MDEKCLKERIPVHGCMDRTRRGIETDDDSFVATFFEDRSQDRGCKPFTSSIHSLCREA